MKLKTILSGMLIAGLLFSFSINAFAADFNGGSYSATLRYSVNTKATATKSSSQSWQGIFDTSQYSYFYPDSTSLAATEGSHNTYLVDASGARITSSCKNVPSGGSVSFSASEMNLIRSPNTVKLQICNPADGKILETKGVLVGIEG